MRPHEGTFLQVRDVFAVLMVRDLKYDQYTRKDRHNLRAGTSPKDLPLQFEIVFRSQRPNLNSCNWICFWRKIGSSHAVTGT